MAGDRAEVAAGRTVTARQAQQWLFTLLPAFPLLLLVLRLWHLSRQDVSTMLLLMQYISPLGLLSALLIALVWALPLAVLAVGHLGTLLLLSAPERFDPERSLLARTTARTPGWVFYGAVLVAALTWQMRFLPALLMISLAVFGLRTRQRYPHDPARIRAVCVALPLIVAAVAYGWLLPAILSSVRAGELVTFLLLVLPPGLAVLLTGPVPARYAPALTRGLLVTAALLAPFVLGTIFLRAPVLPSVAIELEVDPAARAAPTVLLGRVITVDDRMTTLLDDAGTVHFIPNDEVRSQTLCPDLARVPYSVVRVHGWHAEETALEWMMPRRRSVEPDPRCDGRPLTPPGSGQDPTPGSPSGGAGSPYPKVRSS